MFLKIEDLPVSQFMTAFPISVESSVPFKTVVDFMAQRGFANLIVTEDGDPVSVFTEREVLKHIVSKEADAIISIKEIGGQPFTKIEPDTSILDAAQKMVSQKSRLLIFTDSSLVGIITATDMLRAFRETDNDPPITKFVRKDLQKCNSKTSIKDASKIMLEKQIGSVIVSDFAHYGIFTERDVIYCLKERASLNHDIHSYSSWPLIKSEDTINAKGIAQIMAANNVKRLGITHEKDLIGIITAIDLIKAYQKYSDSHISHWDEIK